MDNATVLPWKNNRFDTGTRIQEARDASYTGDPSVLIPGKWDFNCDSDAHWFVRYYRAPFDASWRCERFSGTKEWEMAKGLRIKWKLASIFDLCLKLEALGCKTFGAQIGRRRKFADLIILVTFRILGIEIFEDLHIFARLQVEELTNYGHYKIGKLECPKVSPFENLNIQKRRNSRKILKFAGLDIQMSFLFRNSAPPKKLQN